MHDLLAWMRRRRAAVEAELVTSEQRAYLSPVFYAHHFRVLPLMRRYVTGRLMDLGCGSAPFRAALADRVTSYHGLDLTPRPPDPALAGKLLVGDIQTLGMIPDGAYDSALCIEVLEHVPDPFAATAAIYRILRPGGVAVITVPHLSRLHDLPHDYYRYTGAGLTAILTRAGFEIVELHAKGGLFTFVGHQLSTILLALAWSLPPLRGLLMAFNRYAITGGSVLLDRLIDTTGTFPQGYMVAARKPEAVP